MTRECSGCGLRSCDGRCFSECAADYPDETSAIDRFHASVERALKLQQLTECRGDPLLKHNRRAA